MTSSPLNIGLAGYGMAGATFHAPLIGHSAGVRLAAIATSKPGQARRDWPEAEILPDADALIAHAGIDLVVIATPNDTHFALARRALEAGKHVVVDKPVTLHAADARALAKFAAARALLFAPFHNRRWDGDFLTVRALIDSGRLGRITHYESHFDRFRPQLRVRWREDATRGGGLLYDLGPHLIDQALVLFGPPETVAATLATQRDGAQADDYMHLQFGYADGKQVIMHASVLTALEAPRYTIHGTAGSYVKHGLDTQEEQLKAGLRPGQPGWGKNPPGMLRTVADGLDVRGELATRDGEYAAFYAAVADAVRGDLPFPVTPAQAVQVMALIELARESHASARRLDYRPLR
jgi:scyllo-inositol 2-dehydrogenase (NADP+)